MPKPDLGMLHPPYILGIDDRQRDILWRKARERSGVRELTFHDAKHEACTRMCKHTDVFGLSKAVGTKNVTLLQNTYYQHDAEKQAQLFPSHLAENARPTPP